MRPQGAGAAFERRSADWVGVEEAQERILSAASSLPSEEVVAAEAAGRVLAAGFVAAATLPPWDNSAMDGYAVRAEDVRSASAARPVGLRVVGRIHAGHAGIHSLGPGEAARIMTGAPLPLGADAVVRVEDTDAEGERSDHVAVRAAVEAGRYVRPAGEDFQAGDRVIEAGRVVTPGVVALSSALGRALIPVHRRPCVALLATGDELRPVDRYEDVLAGAAIPESNRPMLAAMVHEAGGTVGSTSLAPDDPDQILARIEEADEDDVLVTIGGASMGEADLVKRVLDRAGFEQDFWRVRMRPGSPFSFGFLRRGQRRQAVFGLPGNPSSAFVTFELFVRPFLRRLAGHSTWFRPMESMVAAEELTGPSHLAAYLRVQVDRGVAPPAARLTGPQGSGLVRGLALADGLAVIPEGVGRVPIGAPVSVMLLSGNASRVEA